MLLPSHIDNPSSRHRISMRVHKPLPTTKRPTVSEKKNTRKSVESVNASKLTPYSRFKTGPRYPSAVRIRNTLFSNASKLTEFDYAGRQSPKTFIMFITFINCDRPSQV